MEKTGQSFDINPDTFTLQHVFAMELHQYKDAISEIVAAAQKELSIERVSLLRQVCSNCVICTAIVGNDISTLNVACLGIYCLNQDGYHSFKELGLLSPSTLLSLLFVK